MHQVIKQINFSYGHRLMKHPGKCAHYHGHNGCVEVVCSAKELDENEMVIAFENLSGVLKKWIDETLDHRMILHEKDEMIPFLEKHKEPFVILPGDPTAEMMAKMIYDQAVSYRLPVTEIRFWETPTSCAVYSVAA